jgi:hypothetical protein
MDVRQVRPTDAPLVLALALEHDAHLVRSTDQVGPDSLLHTLVHSTVSLAFASRAWIAREGTSVALLQACPRRYVIGWDISRLVVRGNQAAVLGPVLAIASSYIHGRGVPRLFARCGDTGAELLKAHGFHAIAREYVMVGPDEAVGGDTPLPQDSRYRMPQDAWPLHQLENSITPVLVRQLEGLSSSDWSYRVRDMSEIVVERDGRIAAWIGWSTKPRNGYLSLKLLVHPDHKGLGADLLYHVLHQSKPRAQFRTRVREYQVETLAAFEEAGFEITAKETVLVKHAAVESARVEERARPRAVRVPGIPALPTHLGMAVTVASNPPREPVWLLLPARPGVAATHARSLTALLEENRRDRIARRLC